MIIVDTNVLSELMRPEPSSLVRGWVQAQRPGELCTTAVTVAEIRYGLERLPAGRRKESLLVVATDIFSALGEYVQPFDSGAAIWYARIVSSRESRGLPIEGFDAQIAAICRSHGAALATRNVKDFAETGIDVIDPWQSLGRLLALESGSCRTSLSVRYAGEHRRYQSQQGDGGQARAQPDRPREEPDHRRSEQEAGVAEGRGGRDPVRPGNQASARHGRGEHVGHAETGQPEADEGDAERRRERGGQHAATRGKAAKRKHASLPEVRKQPASTQPATGLGEREGGETRGREAGAGAQVLPQVQRAPVADRPLAVSGTERDQPEEQHHPPDRSGPGWPHRGLDRVIQSCVFKNRLIRNRVIQDDGMQKERSPADRRDRQTRRRDQGEVRQRGQMRREQPAKAGPE
jgi:predicted nucleic acid-binding protein